MTAVEHVMGMGIVVDIRDGDVGRAPVDEVFDWLRFVDETFSTYKAESEISRLERGELALADAAREVGEVLERCDELREETRGYFDSRAGGSLDPSGLVKGWAVDRAARILEDAGARNFAIYAGGDVIVRGRPSTADRWHIGVRHPTAQTAWRPSSRPATSRSPRRARMREAITCSTRTPVARLPASCR